MPLERLIQMFSKYEKMQGKLQLFDEEAYILDWIETEEKYYSLAASLKKERIKILQKQWHNYHPSSGSNKGVITNHILPN